MNNISISNEILLVAFVGLTGFALLAQAIILFGLFLGLRKTAKTLQADFEEMRETLTPILKRSRDLLETVGPKIESISTDLAALAQALREQGAEIQASTGEVLERVHRQTSRVDTMFTRVLDGVDQAGTYVSETVSRPLRRVSAAIASVKAFVTALKTGRREPRPADQDTFV